MALKLWRKLPWQTVQVGSHTPTLSPVNKQVFGGRGGNFFERFGQWLGRESCQIMSTSLAFKKFQMTLIGSWVKCEFKAIGHCV